MQHTLHLTHVQVQRVRQDLRIVIVAMPAAAPSFLAYFAARTTVAPKQQAAGCGSGGGAPASPQSLALPVMQCAQQHPVQVPAALGAVPLDVAGPAWGWGSSKLRGPCSPCRTLQDTQDTRDGDSRFRRGSEGF